MIQHLNAIALLPHTKNIGKTHKVYLYALIAAH